MKNTARCLSVIFATLIIVSTAHAQKAPRIGYVYPAGGQQGQTFEITVGGQGLTGVSDVYFTGRGVEATVVAFQRPLSGKETELLRDKLKQLEDEKKAASPSSAKPASADAGDEIVEIKEKLACFGNGRPFNNAIAENVTLRVKMAPDARLGDQEIRLASPSGLSNPLVFCVGQIPEFSEPPAKGSLKAEIDGNSRRQRKREPKTEVKPITLPAVMNGQILAGEEDRFRFTAHRGQRVLVAVSARKLVPYLPDAVPGWFQATLTIYDAQGRELAYADDFRFNPDPVLCYALPKDGEYEIAIRDSIYRGREDFVYRITVGEMPFVTSIFPLGGSVGTTCNVQMRGWNLPSADLALNLKDAKPGLLPLVATRGQSVSNFVPFAVDTLPEVLEKEPNNATATPQPLTPPVIVNGRIDQPGDTDVFRIEGKEGSEIVAEIYARRLNSPLDSVLKLTDAAGKQLALNDDNEDKGAGLTTHHADSRLTAKLPADGTYFLHLADAQHGGSPDHSYRLRVSEPRPNFALHVVPSSISGRSGAKVPLTIHAVREDGFTGEIVIALKDAPTGFVLSGGNVPAGMDQAKLTITLPEALEDPVAIEIVGSAKIGDAEVAHRAVPAEDMQQAFAYRHLVPAKELRVAVAGRLTATGQVKIASETPVKIPLGGSARIQITAAISEKPNKLEMELSDPPTGITLKHASSSAEGAEIELASDASKMVAGEKGSLIVQTFSARMSVNGKIRRIPLGALPSIPFEIVEK